MVAGAFESRLGPGIIAIVLSASVPAESAPVEVRGGPDASGQVYEWSVKNLGSNPVVGIEFEHYGGSVFFAPDGWSGECENLVNVGVAHPAGRCTSTAKTASEAITLNESRTFRMQLAPRAAVAGQGAMRIRFSDGAEHAAGVTLPVREPLGDRYVPLVGLAGIALLVGVYKILLGRKKSPKPSSSA
jgi:hypothetical protein